MFQGSVCCDVAKEAVNMQLATCTADKVLVQLTWNSNRFVFSL